jgi:hypothetical protein
MAQQERRIPGRRARAYIQVSPAQTVGRDQAKRQTEEERRQLKKDGGGGGVGQETWSRRAKWRAGGKAEGRRTELSGEQAAERLWRSRRRGYTAGREQCVEVESAEVRMTIGRRSGGKQHKDSGPEAGGRRGVRKEEHGRRKSRSDRVVVLID